MREAATIWVVVLGSLTVACARPAWERCAPEREGHSVSVDGECLTLLPHDHGEADPEVAATFTLAPGELPDWQAIDAALSEGAVKVVFEAGTWDERLDIDRGDDGDHRLILEGRAAGAFERAVVPGIHTGFDRVQSHITVRGFEVTGSRDKGVWWYAGDEVLLEDLVVHGNRGTPAVALEYSARTGHRSSRFVLRNSHIYDQTGECVYIGGSEGEDAPSHARVEIVNNLVHDCWHPLSTQHDAINVKDRIESVLVHRNVVMRSDWGLEIASAGVISNNLVAHTLREGIQVVDGFQAIGGIDLIDNAVVNAGANGLQILAVRTALTGPIAVDGLTVIGADRAAIRIGSHFDMQIPMRDVALFNARVGFDGWGDQVRVELGACRLGGNAADDANALAGLAAACSPASAPNVGMLAGPDRTFFTPDDPWLVEGGASLPE